jgi:hypothetical protein
MTERIEASLIVERASTELGIRLADLIALSSIWLPPEIYGTLAPAHGVWYPDRRRANLGLRVDGKPVEAVGEVIDGITLDNNTYANTAFKTALGVERDHFVGFHICHIWPNTAYDVACYTNLANLVAIPAELSSLTDHHPQIVACLKYRSWELYHWKPAKEVAPAKPAGYPEKWSEPWPANDAARRTVSRRVRGASQGPEESSTGEPKLRIDDAPRALKSANEAAEAALVAAFYLSKFDHERLGLGNQGQAIDTIARSLGVNRNSLRQNRDHFDSHTGSRRQGWKVPLSPSLESVFRRLRHVAEPDLRKTVLSLIR